MSSSLKEISEAVQSFSRNLESNEARVRDAYASASSSSLTSTKGFFQEVKETHAQRPPLLKYILDTALIEQNRGSKFSRRPLGKSLLARHQTAEGRIVCSDSRRG